MTLNNIAGVYSSVDTTTLVPQECEVLDGTHAHVIDAALHDLLGDDYSKPVSERRIPRKSLHLGPGELIVPRKTGWHIQSVRELRITRDRTRIIGYGPMPAVLRIDGCAEGGLSGPGIIEGRRGAGLLDGGRYDVPTHALQVHKSIASHDYPQQSHFKVKDTTIEGVWREGGFRGGSDEAHGAQQDHYLTEGLLVRASGAPADLDGADDIDLCKYGIFDGSGGWNNDRRHVHLNPTVSWCGAAYRSQMTGADIYSLHTDGCRDVVQFNGAVVNVNFFGGEAEYCQRLVNDAFGNDPHMHQLLMRGFYAKLDKWRPGLPGVMLPYRQNACGFWGTRGGLILEDVTVGSLPVARGVDGKLYYAPMGRVEHITNLPAPRIWSGAPGADIYTIRCKAQGYRQDKYRTISARNELFAFDVMGSGEGIHDDWQDTDEHAQVIYSHAKLARLRQRAKDIR